MRCWVIFSGISEIWYLRLLKPGFRHCFVMLNDGKAWISIDPMAHHTEVIRHDLPPTYNVISWLKAQGFEAIEAPIKTPICRALFPMFFTCVESVKRILGLRNVFILTPWQLYSYLHKNT